MSELMISVTPISSDGNTQEFGSGMENVAQVKGRMWVKKYPWKDNVKEWGNDCVVLVI